MSGMELIPLVMGGGGILLAANQAMLSEYTAPSPNIPWYDGWNSYIDISEEYTYKIDLMLDDKMRGQIGNKLVIQGNRIVPNVGFHYWRDNLNKVWVGLAKNNHARDGDNAIYYYTLFFLNTRFYSKEKSAVFFLNELFKSLKDTVNVIRYENTDNGMYKPITVNTICKSPHSNQKDALNIIMESYTDANNFNVKTIICGKSGVGKSYTAMLAKRWIEKKYKNTNVQLFDNFDPSAAGMDINKMVLQKATEETPVIVVINEIDNLYTEVHEDYDVRGGDPRIPHTKNRLSFHNMLDHIAGTKYVIAIYTTEKSQEDIEKMQNTYSFIRKGRVDFFIKMDENSSERVEQCSDKDWEKTN